MSGFTTISKKSGTSNGTIASGGGNLNPFGSLETSTLTASGQAAFIYGINSTQWITSSVGTGATVTAVNSLMSCSSGTSSTGYSDVRLDRGLKYRPGQGSICRLTSIFDAGETNTLQLAGIGNNECGYYFAMSGSNFGILHRERSNLEIRALTITVAPAGPVSITVTLGGNSKVVSITPSSSTTTAAYQLSTKDYYDVGKGWHVEAVGNIIYFISKMPEPINGTFSATGTGFTGTFSQVQAGSNPIDNFIPRTSWNIDPLDGTGHSRVNISPTNGNIYQIGYQYLGFGDVIFSAEDPEQGTFTACHRFQFANNRQTTNVKNPHMFARWSSINKGSVTGGATIKGASAASFTEGYVLRNIGINFSSLSTKTVSTSMLPIMTIRSNRVFNGGSAFGEVDIFNLSVGTDTGASATNRLTTVYIYKGASLTGPVNFTSIDSRSMVSADSSATGIDVTNAVLIKSFLVAANSSIVLTLINENFFLSPGSYFTIAAKATNDVSVTASMSWFEDQ